LSIEPVPRSDEVAFVDAARPMRDVARLTPHQEPTSQMGMGLSSDGCAA
jgi:hypothetical protein